MEGLTEMDTAGFAVGVTFMEITFELTDRLVTQVMLLVSTQYSWSPCDSMLLENELELTPTLTPFSFHWYTGEAPPFTAVAVKVTNVPEQILFEGETEMLTDGATDVVTDIVIALEVAVSVLTQVRLVVITQVILLPLTSDELV